MRDTGNGKVQTLGAVEHRALYTSIDPLQSMTREEKLDILRRVDKVARAADQRVQEVSASLSGVYELIWSPPPMALWPPTFVRWFVFPSACWWKRMASVSAAAAAVAGVLVMTISSPPRGRRAGRCRAKEAVRMALVNLSAVAAPAGCCRWCSAPAGPASCCMKRSAMGWKAISTGVAPRSLAAIWGISRL